MAQRLPNACNQLSPTLQRVVQRFPSNYYPISSQYQAGEYGCGSFVLALLLCFILIGIIVFIYMLIVKPPGTLTVVYEYREVKKPVDDAETSETKICPMCAEDVRALVPIP